MVMLVGCRGWFAGEVAGAPEIPAGDRAIGLPLFGAAEHGVGFGEHVGGDGLGFRACERFWSEGEQEAFADAVVGDREDVGATEAEDEEHFDRPGTDAADGGESADDFVVGQPTDLGEGGDGAVDGFGSEVAQGEGLGAGEAGAAQDVVGDSDELFGLRVQIAEGFDEAAQDGGGCFAMKLLIDDGLEQGFEGRVLAFEFQRKRAGAVDQHGQLRISRREMRQRGLNVVANSASSVIHGSTIVGGSRLPAVYRQLIVMRIRVVGA